MIAVKWIRICRIAGFLVGASLSVNSLRASPPKTAAVKSVAAPNAKTPVHSSVLAAVAYDGSKKILELEFHSGSTFQYLDVPESVFRELMNAESKGRFYNRNIKRHFKSRKVAKP